MFELFDEFNNFLKVKKNASVNTLSSYKRDIKAFIEFLQKNNITSFVTVDSEIISKYVKSIKNQGKSISTVSRNLSSLRTFFKYLVNKKIIQFNPMLGIKNEKKDTDNLPEIMSSDDMNLLLNNPDVTTPKGCRDKAMLETMYATGMRVSELLSLKVTDVNIEIGYILLNKGTSKERALPLYPIAIDAISKYLNDVRKKFLVGKKKSEILFLNINGEPLTRQGFWKIIKQYAQNTQIGTGLTPKILRHSFATHLLENGADIHLIKDMLGHSDISSTMVYTKVLRNKYMSVYENCHPRAKQH